MTTIVTIGIDLAKNVFAVYGVDATGKPALVRPSAPLAKLIKLIVSLPPCLIGMEACSGAHHWARKFQRFGQGRQRPGGGDLPKVLSRNCHREEHLGPPYGRFSWRAVLLGGFQRVGSWSEAEHRSIL